MIGVLAFSDKGNLLADRVQGFLGDEILRWDKATCSAKDFVAEHFHEMNGFLFVGAVGICVRMIAPHIRTKDTDPAVVVMDELGQYVIPVLAGHIGGANRMAKELAEHTGALPVITTATDLNQKFAVDVWTSSHDMVIEDISQIKHISGAVLQGNPVALCSRFPVRGEVPGELTVLDPDETDSLEDYPCGIRVSLNGEEHPFLHTLNAIPKIVTLGLGCRRGMDPDVFEETILAALHREGISLKSVEAAASIDLKKNEACILRFCEKYKIPFTVYTAEELMETEGEFDHSDFVEQTTGADNICERACVRKSGGKLTLKKMALQGITLAAAEKGWVCEF